MSSEAFAALAVSLGTQAIHSRFDLVRGGLTIAVENRFGKKHQQGLRLTIAGGGPGAVFRAETGLDALGKRLKVNREVMTGDPAFDPRVYVESAVTDSVLRPLLANAEVRAAIVKIVAADFVLTIE